MLAYLSRLSFSLDWGARQHAISVGAAPTQNFPGSSQMRMITPWGRVDLDLKSSLAFTTKCHIPPFRIQKHECSIENELARTLVPVPGIRLFFFFISNKIEEYWNVSGVQSSSAHFPSSLPLLHHSEALSLPSPTMQGWWEYLPLRLCVLLWGLHLHNPPHQTPSSIKFLVHSLYPEHFSIGSQSPQGSVPAFGRKKAKGGKGTGSLIPQSG